MTALFETFGKKQPAASFSDAAQAEIVSHLGQLAQALEAQNNVACIGRS
jgi:hypothetical protein